MKVAIFSARNFEKPYLEKANVTLKHELVFFEACLNKDTLELAKSFPAICCFVTDKLDANVIHQLKEYGVKIISLRSAGFNHVDIKAAQQNNIVVARVPAYSPYAVAEFAVGIILTLNRKIHRAYNRTREYNFSLDGLLGFDLHQKTVGIIGTGKIGAVLATIMNSFGCNILASDPVQNEECIKLGVKYVSLTELYQRSDIISLHCPLTPQTRHIIGEEALSLMKHGVMLINTGRGALIDTTAVIAALKSGKIGYLGLDVYEEEENLFFRDLSDTIITDDLFARLMTFPNVLITGHQAFFTQEALTNIAKKSLMNITAFETGSGDLERVV